MEIYFPNLSFKDPQSLLEVQSFLVPQSLELQSFLTPQSLELLQSWVFLSVQDPQSWVFQSFVTLSNLEVQSLKDFQSWLLSLSAQSFLDDQADSQSAFLVSHSARVLETQLLRSSCLVESQEWLLEALSCLASITPAKSKGIALFNMSRCKVGSNTCRIPNSTTEYSCPSHTIAYHRRHAPAPARSATVKSSVFMFRF